MKVTIATGGHTVEIESTNDDMTVHRLANIAVNTWRRTIDPDASPGPAYGGAHIERRERPRTGRWGSGFGFGDPPMESR